MHVHTIWFADSSLDLARRAAAVFFPLYLANGATGIREMGTNLDSLSTLRRRIPAGTVLAHPITHSCLAR